MTRISNVSSLLLSATVGTAATLALQSAPASAISFTENFDSATLGLNIANPSNAGSFTVTSGTVDVIGNGFFDLYPGNGNYVDLNGSSTGEIGSSTLAFTPGETVALTFNYGANGDNRTATFTLFGQTFNIPTASQDISPTPTFNTFTQFFTANSATSQLIFTSTNPGNAGILLDNISLSSVAIPEPFTIIGTVVGGTAAVRMRKKLKARK